MHILGLGHDEQPRGSAIEAVDDAGPPWVRAARCAAGERLGERPGSVPARRMHHDPGRLVHDEQVLVLVDDVVRRVAGLRGRPRVGLVDRDAFAAGEAMALRPHRPVHPHMPGVDQALGAGA